MQLIMETLSPVQVGSGEELLSDLDYIQHEGAPFIVDQNRCFELLAAQGDAATASSAKTLSLALQQLDEPYGYALPSLHGAACKPQSIREQLKDAQWRPLIPGSSLKGAIRTALLAEFLRSEQSQHQRKRWIPTSKGNPKTAIKPLAESFFSPQAPRNKAPNHDLMRAWKIGDTAFAQDDLCLADVRFLNLGREGDETVLKWKNMSGRNSVNDWKQASGVHVEALPPGAVAPFQIHVDEFLLHGKQARQQMNWDGVPDSFPSLREVLNNHAEYRLRREVEFYGQYGCQQALNACIQLMQIMEQEEDAIYLQMGWGSGWRGMTGDWQHDAGIESDMRTLYRLGKTGMDEFPKTRRLAVYDGAPSLPFGWLRLWQAEDRPVLHEQASASAQKQLISISARNNSMLEIQQSQQRKLQEAALLRLQLQAEAEERQQIQAEEEARKAAMLPLDRDLETWNEMDANQRENQVSAWVERMQEAEPDDALRIAMELQTYLQETGHWVVKKKGARKERVRKVKVILQQHGCL